MRVQDLSSTTGSPDLATEQAEQAALGRRDLPIMRRMSYFWLVIVVAMLVTGSIQASSDHPALWHGWRGLAMAELALAYAGWYLLLPPIRTRYGWPVPRRIAYPYVAAGFAITAALLSIDLSFLGLAYALIGLTVGSLPTRRTFVPVGAAILMYGWALGLLPPGTHGRSWFDVLEGLFSIGLGVGITYTLAALIGQRYQLERLVRELHEAQQRLSVSAAREVELAALRERNRLAREMHDSLGHALVLIAVKIEAAQRLHAIDPSRATAEWEDTKALVRATMGDLRRSLAGLRLPALDEQPFSVALAELASDLRRGDGIDVAVDIAEEADALDRTVQEALYRVAQEALANVAKHACARHAALTLALHAGTAVLEVGDDGIGLGAAPRGAGHYGVVGMRERVEALGGLLTLGPRPEGGTLLRASAPLKEGAGVRDPHPVG